MLLPRHSLCLCVCVYHYNHHNKGPLLAQGPYFWRFSFDLIEGTKTIWLVYLMTCWIDSKKQQQFTKQTCVSHMFSIQKYVIRNLKAK